MRTSGTFQDVYKAARDHYFEGADTRPLNPVIRRENGRWMLESGINSKPDADLEVALESFDSFWYEGYQDEQFEPDENDVAEFVKTVTGWAGDIDPKIRCPNCGHYAEPEPDQHGCGCHCEKCGTTL